MAIEIVKKFVVNAPPTVVWGFLTDPQRVAHCMPGAAITDRIDEKTYAGTMAVKVGPVSTGMSTCATAPCTVRAGDKAWTWAG